MSASPLRCDGAIATIDTCVAWAQLPAQAVGNRSASTSANLVLLTTWSAAIDIVGITRVRRSWWRLLRQRKLIDSDRRCRADLFFKCRKRNISLDTSPWHAQAGESNRRPSFEKGRRSLESPRSLHRLAAAQ